MMTILGIEDGRCTYSDIVDMYIETFRQFPELRSTLKSILDNLDSEDYSKESVDQFNKFSEQLMQIQYRRT